MMAAWCKNSPSRENGNTHRGCWIGFLLNKHTEPTLSQGSTELQSSLLLLCQYAFELLWRWKPDDAQLYFTRDISWHLSWAAHHSQYCPCHRYSYCTSDHQCYWSTLSSDKERKEASDKELSALKCDIKGYLIGCMHMTHYLFNCRTL